MSTLQDVETAASTVGLNMLGLAAPLLAIRWSADSSGTGPGGDPTEGASGTLNLGISSSDQWVAPAAGVLSFATPGNRILKPDGTPAAADAALFRIHGQAYLRLARLIRAVMEGGNDGLPIRPAPLFFVYSGADITGATAGTFAANAPMGIKGGALTVHDIRGLAIDPVAAAEIFDTLLATFGVLEARDTISAAATPADGRQIHKIAGLGDGGVRVHLIDPHGHPGARTQLQGLEDLDAASGLFKVTSGTVSITRVTNAPADLRLGAATNGKLGTSFSIPTPSKTLRRDFLRVMIADMKPFLIGEIGTDDPAAGVERAIPIRHGETLTFSFNGNAMFGAANSILTGTPADSLVVSPEIAGDFTLPTDATDAQAQWPKFPAGLPTVNDAPPAGLRDNFNPTAAFITGTDADVAVTINGLTAGHAIRVYNRRFLPDAREGRGDGAGAAVPTGQTSVSLRLKDPFGLVSPGITTVLPTKPILHVDMVVVNSNKKGRVFGNVTAEVAAPATPPAITPETNLLGTATDRGTSLAGILGLPAPPLPGGPFDTFDQVIGLVRALGSEGTPRDAPRLPTMARRDAMVASDTSGTWKGQISGSHYVGAARNALQRIGSPGSHGGIEFHSISAQTSGGQLAYDIARSALRRTRNIVSRLLLLRETRWAEPPAATAGSVSGAVLQTISPATETPELAAVPSLLLGLPADWNSFLSQVLPSLPSSLSGLSGVGNLGNSPEGIRVYDEMKREFSASVHGRRDAFRALLRAIKAARELIYIENAAFTATAYGTTTTNDLVTAIQNRLNEMPSLRVILCLSKNLDYGPGYEPFAAREFVRRKEAVEKLLGRNKLFTVDSSLAAGLDSGTVSTDLKTAFSDHSITLSADVAISIITPGSRWVLDDRKAAKQFQIRGDVEGVGTPLSVFAGEPNVVAFHPIGFPGRALRLLTNLTVVDDVWALIGSSTIRRRGLTFDGGVDIALFDTQLREGRGSAISELRRQSMAFHLGATDPKSGGPNPTFVRLLDPQTAFSACKELLDQGGAGLIEPLFDGKLPGVASIPPSAFPSDDIADPEGRIFDPTAGLNFTLPFLGMIAAASVAAARP
jgi:hypothetical protein